MIGKHEMGPEEAAEALGLTVEQLLERAGNGDIPQTVLGRDGWRFRRQAIERLLERRGSAKVVG